MGWKRSEGTRRGEKPSSSSFIRRAIEEDARAEGRKKGGKERRVPWEGAEVSFGFSGNEKEEEEEETIGRRHLSM